MKRKYSIKAILLLSAAVFLVSNCGIKTNPELMKLLKSIPENCELGTERSPKSYYGWKLDNCKNSEDKKGKELIKEMGVAKAIPSLVVAFGDDNEKVSAAATYFLNWNVGSSYDLNNIAKNPELIEDKVVDEFLSAFDKRKNEDYVQYATRAVTNLAAIKGKESKLWAIYDSAEEKARFKSSLVATIMKYSGMKSFDKIKEIAGSSDRWAAAGAVRAPGSIRDIRNNQEALDKLCPWWKSYLANDEVAVAAAAASSINTRCGGEYVDAALVEIEKRLGGEDPKKAKSMGSTLLFVKCSATNKRYSEEQCAKATALRAKIEALK